MQCQSAGPICPLNVQTACIYDDGEQQLTQLGPYLERSGLRSENASDIATGFSSTFGRRRMQHSVSNSPDGESHGSAGNQRNRRKPGSNHENGVRCWLFVSVHSKPGSQIRLFTLVSQPQVQKLQNLEASSPRQTPGPFALYARSKRPAAGNRRTIGQGKLHSGKNIFQHDAGYPGARVFADSETS